MTTPQQPAPSADDFLMGTSIPSAKFPVVNTTVTGRILQPPTVEQQRDYTTGELKFWDDGKPRMQLVVTLATAECDPLIQDDDGSRRLYVKGQMKTAIAQAIRGAGARGLEVGGTLTITYSSDGQKSNPRFNAPKQFTAQYTAAASTHLDISERANTTGEITDLSHDLIPQRYAATQRNPATSALAQRAGQEPPF